MKNSILIALALLSFGLFGQGQFQNEAFENLKAASTKIMQLAEALPEETYEWSPEDGVRSVTEVFGHVIAANYFFASKMGAEMPTDVDMKALRSGEDISKEEMIQQLKRSYDFILGAIKSIEDGDLGNTVDFPAPGEFTIMSACMFALSHNNEHLGQLIAYSRVNGIAPPWSEAAEK